jgi:uncharacterized membrane protein
MPVHPDLLADRRGAVALLFALLAPLLLLAVAFGIDVPAWYRDALHLQGLADRAALSAAPLWAEGQHKPAIAVAEALVAADGATLDHAGADRAGGRGFEVAVSSRKAHLLASLPLGEERQQAHAVAVGRRLVE